VLMFRTAELKRNLYFLMENWTGGIYGTVGFLGSKSSCAVAGAWFVMNSLGVKGYLIY